MSRWQKCYPVEGDSAVAEFLDEHGDVYADLSLDRLDVKAIGEARLARAVPKLTVHRDGATVDASSLSDALGWLIENERGRLPQEE